MTTSTLILDTLRERPQTAPQLRESLSLPFRPLMERIEALAACGAIVGTMQDGSVVWSVKALDSRGGVAV